MKNESYINVEDDVKLHVTDIGEGNPVVLIHGWPESDEIFKYQYTFLKQHGFRAIGITLRGYGKSDRSPGTYNFDTFSKDIHQVIQILKLEKVALAGFSMGGAVAAHFIAHYQPTEISRLIIICSNVPFTTKRFNYPEGPAAEEMIQFINYLGENFREAIDVYGPMFQLTDKILPLEIGKWINNINYQSSSEAAISGIDSLKNADLSSFLNQIKIPTALFHAVDDNVVPFKLAVISQKLIPCSELIRFETGGHWIMFTQTEAFNTEMVNFLKLSKN